MLSRNLKQDLVLNTEICPDNKIKIDGQFIGELKGLKFKIALNSSTLETDIKSIKKAARKGIQEELKKRVEKIINNNELNLNEDNKIIWNGDIIAKLKKGKNYLSPNIEIISDDALDDDELKRQIKYFS